MSNVTLEFRAPRANVTTGKRGRPEKFTPEIRAALAANVGEFAVVQTGIKSASRATVLRKRYAAEGFEFVAEKGEDGLVTILARAVAPEAPARKRAPRAKAKPAE